MHIIKKIIPLSGYFLLALFLSIISLFSGKGFAQEGYKNFEVAVYARSYEVRKMADTHWLDSIWNLIEKQVHVDKIYLETHRDLVMVQEDTLQRVKKYFRDRGIKTSGGITYTISEPNRFQTFCYSNPADRDRVRQIMEYTAKHFNEVILDDFFFTNCKCNLCIKAKGEMSWTDFRLKLMDEAARELILEPARKIKPDVKVIIKYPNWYAHFQGLGFNLETEPALFDGIYTGTETRDAYRSAQHLQPYHGYSIFRYFENIKPGGNLGGWVDTGGSLFLDRYAEQLWITLFAKAPEITLFDFRQMQRLLADFPDPPWKDMEPVLDRNEMMEPHQGSVPLTIARTAGYVFEKTDPLIGQLGRPVGIPCYRPYHSVGEDFLPSFLGMAGLPIELVPEFPAEEPIILLTRSAATDKDIIAKIRQQLMNGKSVIITSGLLDALQDKGLSDIAELRYTGNKALVNNYVAGWRITEGEQKILIPQVKYLTNDSWELVSAIDGPNGWPLLHEAEYANGSLFVLTIPDNYADICRFPEEVLNSIRAHLMKYLPMQLNAPGEVSIFFYDNNTLIVESFRDKEVSITLTGNPQISSLTDMEKNETIEGVDIEAVRFWGRTLIPARRSYTILVPPHSYKALRLENLTN